MERERLQSEPVPRWRREENGHAPLLWPASGSVPTPLIAAHEHRLFLGPPEFRPHQSSRSSRRGGRREQDAPGNLRLHL